MAIALGTDVTCVYLNEHGQIVISDDEDFIVIAPADLGDLIEALQFLKTKG
jgi:hypothetical protein